MKLLLPGIVILTGSIALAAQAAPPVQTDLQFEVASIRRNVSAETGAQVRIQPNGQLTVTNNTLFNIVRNAYGVQPFQIVPGERMPDWFNRDRWDIVAKAPEELVKQQQRLLTLLQNLLADRFKLVARRESREMPVYALLLARADGRLGPQIRQASPECEAARLAREKGQTTPPQITRGFCGTRAGNGSVSTSAVALADFARNLAPMTGRFVIDRTGLTGSYDLDLKWTPDQALAGAAAGAATDGTSLFAALQEQLGLKLEAQRAPVEVLVIESAERPAED
jgi:uncharacterized protein (TIGR03435 family)